AAAFNNHLFAWQLPESFQIHKGRKQMKRDASAEHSNVGAIARQSILRTTIQEWVIHIIHLKNSSNDKKAQQDPTRLGYTAHIGRPLPLLRGRRTQLTTRADRTAAGIACSPAGDTRATGASPGT